MVDGSPTSSSERTLELAGEPVSHLRRPLSDVGPGRVRIASLSAGNFTETEGDAALADLGEIIGRPDAAVWVDLSSPSATHVETVGSAIGLHPLIVEDVLEGNKRAKIETTDGLVHIVLFVLPGETRLALSEVDIVLSRGFLLTVHNESWDPRLTHHLRGDGLPALLKRGVDHLLWALADSIVDGYFPYADRLGDQIDEVQDAVIRKATPDTLERLFALKRELIEVRRAAGPTREVFNQLTNRDLTMIDEEELIWFRDVYDHVIRLTDEMDNYRELASSTLDVYLTQVNNNLSVIMKRLTGVTVILAGIGAVAGIFGMSEAGAAFSGAEAGGFWTVTAFVVAMSVIAALFLRRIDWI